MKQPIVILFTVVFGIFGFISIYYAKTDTFLDTLRDFSIALLTVLIPFALAVMTDLLSKQSVNVEFKTLDLHVILDCILKVKLFIFSIVVLFGLLTLMDIESKNIQFLLFSLWLFPLGFIVGRILDFYSWSKGDVWDFRLHYIQKNNKINEYDIIWKSVLSAKFQDARHEEKIMQVFEEKILSLASHPKELTSLLSILNNNHENRNFYALINILPTLLKIHKICWEKVYVKHESSSFYQAEFESNELIKTIIDSLSHYKYSVFFDKYKVFVEATENIQYKKHLLHMMFDSMIKHLENLDNSDNIWQAFPKEWLITKTSSINTINKIFIELFFNWAYRKFDTSSVYDKVIADVAQNLFLEVEPMTFTSLFILLAKQDIQEVLEISLGFGGAGRIFTGFGDEVNIEAMEDRDTLQRKETYDIFKMISPKFFNKENIEKVLTELNSVGNLEKIDKWQETRRKRLVIYLNEMLEIL